VSLLIGELDIDAHKRLVRWGGRSIELGDRAFDVLLALAERSDRVVSQNELLDVAWQGLVVGNNNLTVQISTLRKVFGADTIRTVTGRGYRLALESRVPGPSASDVPECPQDVQVPAPAKVTAAGFSLPAALGDSPLPQRVPETASGPTSALVSVHHLPAVAVASTRALTVTPTLARLPRRLVAQVLASVPGWTRLLTRQGAAAVAAWRVLRTELLEPSLAEYGAQTEELTPERVFVSFPSAVDAAQWALHVVEQAALLTPASASQMLHLRIGIVVDDAVVDDGKLLGMGVQAVAELHGLAQHGEVVVDDLVRAMIGDKLAALFLPLDVGLRAGKLRHNALWLLKSSFSGDGERGGESDASVTLRSPATAGVLSGADGSAEPASQVQWQPRQVPMRAAYLPTLAVLPLRNLATEGDAHLATGLTEQVINFLALNKGLAVIAHNSTLAFASRPNDPAEVAQHLGAQYVLSGTLARRGSELQIEVSLLHVRGEAVILKRPFSGALGDVFDFQEQLAADIAAAIDPEVRASETSERLRQPTVDPNAYDYLLRGLALQHAFGRNGNQPAAAHFHRALELDPRYGQAHAQLAWWHALRVGQQQQPNLDTDRQLALEHAQRAVELDPRDANSLAIAAHLQTYLCKRYTEAQALFDQALAINPSCTLAWARSASTLTYLGQGDAAMARVQQAIRLSPHDPERYAFYTTRGTAALVLERYDEAAAWLGQSQRLNPGFAPSARLLVAALMLAGERVQAQAVAEELLVLEPNFSVRDFGRWYPLREPWLGKLLEALRQAGLPP
jgi:adenylate cyclase